MTNKYNPLSFSRTAVITANISVFISFIYSYITGNLLWIPFGMIFTFNLITLFIGINKLLSSINKSLDNTVVNISLTLVILIFICSSLYGIILIFSFIPVNDYSFFAIPFLFIALIFIGAAVGLYHRTPNKL